MAGEDDGGLINLERRVDILIALTLCQLEHRTDPADIIAILGRFNIQPNEIAKLLGMTSNAVRAARYRLSRGARRPRKLAKKK